MSTQQQSVAVILVAGALAGCSGPPVTARQLQLLEIPLTAIARRRRSGCRHRQPGLMSGFQRHRSLGRGRS